jgi:hypothetical protein
MGAKEFNLDLHHKFSDNVIKNIKVVYSKLGESFNIIHGETTIPVRLVLCKYGNGSQIYNMIYDDPNRSTNMHTFKILFYHKKIKNAIKIANIQRNDKLSGTVIIEMIIKMAKLMNVKKIYLQDGSRIACGDVNIILPIVHLLEKGELWYSKFGFKFDVDDNGTNEIYMYKSNKDIMLRLKELAEDIKKITVAELLDQFRQAVDLLNSGKKISMTAFNQFTFQDIDMYSRNIDIEGKRNFYVICINVLEQATQKYLWEYMVWVAKNNCVSYKYLQNHAVDDNIYIISSDDTTIKWDYMIPFNEIFNIVAEYYFVKEL